MASGFNFDCTICNQVCTQVAPRCLQVELALCLKLAASLILELSVKMKGDVEEVKEQD